MQSNSTNNNTQTNNNRSNGGQMLPQDLSAFLMAGNINGGTSSAAAIAAFSSLAGVAPRSTPGSPAAFTGALGFHSVRASPVLGPSVAGSTVPSAAASPVASGGLGPRQQGLLTGMAGLNVSQLPPTAPNIAVTNITGTATGFMDMTNPPHPPATFGYTQANQILQPTVPRPPVSIAQQKGLSPSANGEFLRRVEEIRSRGLRLEMEGISAENAKSRVETQIKITIRLVTADTGERVTCWSHLALPELLASREKFRHRLHRGNNTPVADGNIPLSPQHVVHVEAGIICSTDPTRKVETCIGCIRREYKRSLRRKDASRRKNSAAPSACTTPLQSRPGSPQLGDLLGPSGPGGRPLTGSMELDWDESRIALERQRIVIFNCCDLQDFSKGEVCLPTRVTCYCRHHSERDGFCIRITLRDSNGVYLASALSPPIMITDDHKTTKFKTDRRTTRTRPDYERQHGGGNAAYATHALGSPLGLGGDGLLGGRQAMSARNSPTLRPYGHQALLDTYSQFASLAGTPSLGSTPLGSPHLSAHRGIHQQQHQYQQKISTDFDTSFNLPQAAAPYFNDVGQQTSLFNGLNSAPPVPNHNNSTTAEAAAAAAAAIAASNYSNATAAAATTIGVDMNNISLLSSSQWNPQPETGMMFDGLGNLGQSQRQPQHEFQPPVVNDNIRIKESTTEKEPVPRRDIAITQVVPTKGPVAGGIGVLISGRNFHRNIEVYFGEAKAGHVRVISPSNIACILPPTKSSGPINVRLRDLDNMEMHDGDVDRNSLMFQQVGKHDPSAFSYVEDTDRAMLELSLQAMGLIQQQQQQQQQQQSGQTNVVSPGSTPDYKPMPFAGLPMGSPPVSPLLQSKGSPKKQQLSAAANKILGDQEVLALLKQLRTASEARNLADIEVCLAKAFMALLSKGLLDSNRFALFHEPTGRTLLHFAALLGMANLMTFLATHGISVDATDRNDMTAMHFAAMYGRNDIVEMLLNAGASHAKRTCNGQTAGEIAKTLGYTQIQMAIEEREGYMSFIKDDPLMDPNVVAAVTAQQQQQQSAVPLPTITASIFSSAGGDSLFGQSDNSGVDMFNNSNLLFAPPQTSQQQQQPPQQQQQQQQQQQ